MTTPQEIIKEFDNQIFSKYLTVAGFTREAKKFLISTVIKQYEEMLFEIGEVEKCPVCNGSWIKCGVCENTGVNRERSRIRLSLQSEIKEWKLIDNK